MKLYKIAIFFLVLQFAISPTVLAQVGLEKVAQSTMNFLLVNVSPRAGAMGETFIAVGEGAESIFFNPAGVAETSSRFDLKIYATHWIAGINYMANAFVWNTGNWGAVGASVLWVDYGTINGTSLIRKSDQTLYPLGYKDNGQLDNVGAYALGLSYARAVSDRFLLGGTLRYAGQNLGQNSLADGRLKDNNAGHLIFDAGVKYYTGLKSFRFGMAIRNFSSNLKREEISEPLPILFTMGMAIDLFDVAFLDHTDYHSLTLAVDFLHPNNYTERINIGAEYVLFEAFSLRGGYQSNQDIASWSGGIGLATTIGNMRIATDYSYSDFDIFENVNRFSLGIAF